MRIGFYGVRGSCPCSGEGYLRYGGNTACIAFEVGDEPPIVVDLGSGLRPFGLDLERRRGLYGTTEMTTLLSHLHWDHIIGLPFFTPLLRPGLRMDIYGPAQKTESLREAIDKIVKPPFFPVTVEELQGEIELEEVEHEDFALGSAKVKARLVPHVGPTLGFRIEADGASVAVLCDHQASEDRKWVSPSVLELCDGADLVIHDAQYTDSEYVAKSTWGHSTIEYSLHVAAEAGARALAMFHHDPTHHDDEMDRILVEARDLPEAGCLDEVFAAAEGAVIELGNG